MTVEREGATVRTLTSRWCHRRVQDVVRVPDGLHVVILEDKDDARFDAARPQFHAAGMSFEARNLGWWALVDSNH